MADLTLTSVRAPAFPPLARLSVLLWVAGLVVRLIIVFGLHRYDLFHAEPVKIAISLANTGAFADSYAIPTGYTAHSAPIYPALLAPIYYLWGDTRTSDFIRVVFSIAVAAAGYALLPWVALALRMRLAVGVLAGAVGALLPAHFWPESMGQFETAWIPLFLELSVILLARLADSASLTSRSAMLAGLWCGMGVLLSPSVAPVLLLLALPVVWRFRPASWRWGAVATCAICITIAPWIVRNYVRLGALFFIRDNFGMELYLSNRDGAFVDHERNDVTAFFRREHPFASAEKALELRRLGEVAFDRNRMQRAEAWIRAHPLRFAALTAARIRNFWFQSMLPPVPRVLLWLLNLSALVGLLLLFRDNRPASVVLGSVLLAYPAVYYVIHNGMRYEHGVHWVTLLLAAEFAFPIGGTATITEPA